MQIIFPMAWKYTEICSKTGNKFTLGIALCREKETQAESSTQQVQQNVLSFIFQARDRYLGGHYFILFFFFGYLVYLIYVIITWLERDLVTAHMKQNKSWGIPLNHKLSMSHQKDVVFQNYGSLGQHRENHCLSQGWYEGLCYLQILIYFLLLDCKRSLCMCSLMCDVSKVVMWLLGTYWLKNVCRMVNEFVHVCKYKYVCVWIEFAIMLLRISPSIS